VAASSFAVFKVTSLKIGRRAGTGRALDEFSGNWRGERPVRQRTKGTFIEKGKARPAECLNPP
jgi:hypothetical protein